MEAAFKTRLSVVVVIGFITLLLTGYFAIGAGIDLFNMILNGAPMQYRDAAFMGLFLVILNALFFYASVITARINKHREKERQARHRQTVEGKFEEKLNELLKQKRVIRGEDGGIL